MRYYATDGGTDAEGDTAGPVKVVRRVTGRVRRRILEAKCQTCGTNLRTDEAVPYCPCCDGNP